MKYDFNTNRMKGKVQVNIDKWLSPTDNPIKIHRISGKLSPTGITQACFVGEGAEDIKTDDIILISKVAYEVATTPFANYKIERVRYFDLPAEQILGIFSNTITLETLKMRGKNVLFKRIEKKKDSPLLIEEKNTMLGEILKVGKNSSLKAGDIIAVGDNVSTPIELGGAPYFAVEEKFVVGRVKENLSMENMEILNEYILMKPYIPDKALNSTILETSGIDYNYLDYSDINNRNLFKVAYADKSLGNIKKNDIILLDRNYTNYMYYENEKYFVINDKKWISGKIIERDKQ